MTVPIYTRRRLRKMREAPRLAPCTHCGETKPLSRMALHHTWPATNIHRRIKAGQSRQSPGGAGLSRIVSVPQLKEELKKVIPLCDMCHHIRHLTVREAGFNYRGGKVC